MALVLAAHGTVLKPPSPIDTGLVATEALCQGIAWRLSPHFGIVVNGWLNHTRGGPWTDPPIEDALQQVADAGYRESSTTPTGSWPTTRRASSRGGWRWRMCRLNRAICRV